MKIERRKLVGATMILLSLLTACSFLREAPQTDALQLCFGSDGEEVVERESQTWEISGEVTALESLADDENFEELNLYGCWNTPERMLTVLDADGVSWTLGMGRSNSDLPPLELQTGAAVTLKFSAVFSFGQTAGAVIEDQQGLVFAADLGNWGRALEDQVSADLRVSDGERSLTVQGDCGTQEWGAIDFESGAQKLSLETGESGVLEVGGVSVNALTLASFEYSQTTCTDVAGLESWMVWR
jgi:hypothetical protein